MAQFSPPNSEGNYLPISSFYDSQFIYELDVTSEEFKEFLVIQQETINEHAYYINRKSQGIHQRNEQTSGNQYFSDQTGQTSIINRQEYFFSVNFGQLPNSATKSVAHNIDGISGAYTATEISGAATSTALNRFISLGNDGINISVDGTNITVTTTANFSAYDKCIITVRYLKQAL